MIEIVIWFLGTAIIATVAALLGKKFGLQAIIGVFAGSLIVANAVASKIVVIGPFTLSATLVVYSLTFLLTDTISEFWGKKAAQNAVWSGFLALVMFVFVTQITLRMTPAPFWGGQEAFEQILGSSLRIGLASFLAYIVSQNHDVWAYHFWKKLTKGKYLWIRNNFSTWVSQLLDTLIFYSIAFYGIFPIKSLILSTLFVKVLIALFDTPFLYFIRWYYTKLNPKWKREKTSLVMPV